MSLKKLILIENFLKNILTIAFIFISKPFMDNFLTSVDDYGSILTFTTLLIMAFLFATYAFAYPNTKLKNTIERYINHLLTTTMIYGTGVLLYLSSISLQLQVQKTSGFINFISIIFFLSLVLYDFYDLKNAVNNQLDG